MIRNIIKRIKLWWRLERLGVELTKEEFEDLVKDRQRSSDEGNEEILK